MPTSNKIVRIIRTLLVTLALLAVPASCNKAYLHTSVSETPSVSDSIAHVGMDSAQDVFFRIWRSRLQGHSTLPDIEQVLCVYGLTRHDTAFVGFFRATDQRATEAAVWYQPCGIPDGKLNGALRYLGLIHAHNPDDLPWRGCYFSKPDSTAFLLDTMAPIDLVVCADGVIWRSKRLRR